MGKSQGQCNSCSVSSAPGWEKVDSKTQQCHKVCSVYAGVLGRGGGGYWMGMAGPRLKWRAVDTVGLGFGVVGLMGAGGRQA